MKRGSMFRPFRDPATRPRAIIWAGAVVLLLAVFVVIALGATSTRWFCADVCHKVQDDTIAAYEKSTHSEVSCMACHEPVNANTVVFLLAKMKALGELYTTVTNKYELPLNAGSALSLGEEEMGEGQCVQCHSAKRKISPSRGIIIDHKVHEEKGVWCTVCHNRVAHDEKAAPPKLKNVDGTPNRPHPDFMKMAGCMRCHDAAGKKKAPGACPVCHASSFSLVPASHKASGWFRKGHAEAGVESRKVAAEEQTETAKLVAEGVDKDLAKPVEYCSTCHGTGDFCNDCHGVEMPHPKNFKTSHAAAGKKDPRVCARCHAKGGSQSATEFCNDCHHPGSKAGVSWIKLHPVAVRASGAAACLNCHSPVFCANCHVRGNP